MSFHEWAMERALRGKVRQLERGQAARKRAAELTADAVRRDRLAAAAAWGGAPDRFVRRLRVAAVVLFRRAAEARRDAEACGVEVETYADVLGVLKAQAEKTREKNAARAARREVASVR